MPLRFMETDGDKLNLSAIMLYYVIMKVTSLKIVK
jgi:hypothetical protein